MSLQVINSFILQRIRSIEMVGVLMRIFSFSLVSWLGPASPFLFVWIFNTLDAVVLSWCAILKRDAAYSLLICSGFWWAWWAFSGHCRQLTSRIRLSRVY